MDDFLSVGRTIQTMRTIREVKVTSREPGGSGMRTLMSGGVSDGTSVAQRLILLSLMDVRLPLIL